MSRVYSTLLARGTATPGTFGVVYTVPADRRAVIKHIQSSPAGATPSTLYVQVNGSWTLMYLPLAAGGTSAAWSGMVVMNAGDTLSVTALTNAQFFFISGFELTIP